MEAHQQLAKLIKDAQGAVTVLTGAGISTPSGIPDFRSKGGIWEGVDPKLVASLTAFVTAPEVYWAFHRKRFQGFENLRPNRAHEVLAELEQEGYIKAILTQNIDGLHQQAGSKQVIELHGNNREYFCYHCKKPYDQDEVEDFNDEKEVPRCGCGGVIKPNIVLFEEELSQDDLLAAYDLVEASRLLICIGTSLEVYPIAALPDLALMHGDQLAIITKSETQYDNQAEVILRGEVDQDLDRLWSALKNRLS